MKVFSFKALSFMIIIIKTHDSEYREQEEAGHMQRMSELFTCKTTVKFVSNINNYKSP